MELYQNNRLPLKLTRTFLPFIQKVRVNRSSSLCKPPETPHGGDSTYGNAPMIQVLKPNGGRRCFAGAKQVVFRLLSSMPRAWWRRLSPIGQAPELPTNRPTSCRLRQPTSRHALPRVAGRHFSLKKQSTSRAPAASSQPTSRTPPSPSSRVAACDDVAISCASVANAAGNAPTLRAPRPASAC